MRHERTRPPRKRADRAVGQSRYYGEAEDRLDEAKAKDPGGEDTDRVKAMRGAITSAKPEYPGNAKPPLGPGERPLVPTPPKKK